GQLLARIDDDLARAELAIKAAKLTAAEAEKLFAEKMRDETLERWKTQQKLFGTKPGLSSPTLEDLRNARLSYERYVQEVTSKHGAVEVAKQELNQARKIVA